VTPPTFVIVGASLAGVSAAASLREEGFEDEVILIGAEPHYPYERPLLSKEYLRGEAPFEKTLVRPAAFYEEYRIQMHLGARVTRVDPAAKVVHCESGDRFNYDKLLVATGVRNRRPPIPGLNLEGVLNLRSVEDADALRSQLVPGRRAVVVGMGFIGCEVAASLRQKGVEVVALEPSPTPLFRALGQQVGEVLAAVHRDHGVDTVFGDVVTGFEGERSVERVITRGGRRLECDFVVAAVGVEPAVECLTATGIELDDGVVVDELCRSTAADVYAAGDVANHFHPVFGRRIRIEHWQNAMRQASAAARSMLGKGRPYDDVPWFWSDQYDMNLQYAGFHRDSKQIVVRGNLARREFLAFYVTDGRVEAIAALNRGRDLRRAMHLINARTIVDPRHLEDEDVDLRSLARAEGVVELNSGGS
jgi:3-phenylpropionate/trans-cinnamate dioxygenase ferredoxin reductase component